MTITTIKLIIISSIFLMGLYYFCNPGLVENFNNTSTNCPNILYEKNNKVYLYNSKKAKIPGVNPIVFNNLEEYTEYVEWLRSRGINCPILYLQKSYDTQDNEVYKIRPSPTELPGGFSEQTIYVNSLQGHAEDESPDKDVEYLYPPEESPLIDATTDDKPFNENSYPSYDPQNLYIGLSTPLDKKYHSKSSISANPMDSNWGGVKYTQKRIDAGDYKQDDVSLYTD